MKKLLSILLIFFSFEAYSQTGPKVESLAPAVEKAEANQPATMPVTTQSVNVKKKRFKLPGLIAPINNNGDANCADRLGKGDSGYTACQGAKNSR